jgi:hemerythrin-like domain-containing protein
MTASHDNPAQTGGDDPLDRFSQCHTGILRHLQALGDLPAQARAAAQARRTADETLRFFHDVIHEHHAQEEQELFPAVLASAVAGAEREQVQRIAAQLTREHREVEAAWAALEPALKAIAKGREASLDEAAVAALVSRYQAHAAFEEREFLPLSEQILGRDGNHLAALGLSLHMRHAVPEALERYRGRI